MRIVTITGPSAGITDQQVWGLSALLVGADLVHHGICEGADHVGHLLALLHHIPIVGHPGVDKGGNPKRRAIIPPEEFAVIRAPKPFLRRNENMVRASTEVIALVKKASFYRSGEWNTINTAIRLHIPVTLVLPDGQTEQP